MHDWEPQESQQVILQDHQSSCHYWLHCYKLWIVSVSDQIRYGMIYPFFERTLSLILKSSRTFANIAARLFPVCKHAHSMMSRRRVLATPFTSKCMVIAINAWPLGDIHASVMKFRLPSYACASHQHWFGSY